MNIIAQISSIGSSIVFVYIGYLFAKEGYEMYKTKKQSENKKGRDI